MIEFKSIALTDKELLASYIYPGNRRDNNLSFANLCSWQFLTCSSFTILDHQLVLRFCFPDEKTVYTLTGDRKNAKTLVRTLARQAMEENVPLYLYGIVPEMNQELESIFPGVFEYREDRDHFDYLYLRHDLSELRGKAYQTKRNHVNKFKKSYDYRYTPMTSEMIADCISMYDEWCEDRHCDEDRSLEYEQQALKYGMEHFCELGLSGGVLWVGGRIIAFTFGASVNHDTFCVHAEKALAAYEGAYNTINREFASHLPEHFTYINREEDLGVPGLRKAKLSYRPAFLLEKGIAVCAAGTWDRLF